MEKPEQLPTWMADHIAEDHKFQEHLTNEVLPTLATKEDLKGLAKEKSVRDLIQLQRNINTAVDIGSGAAKWVYRTVILLAPFLVALGVIFGFWKGLLAFLLNPFK